MHNIEDIIRELSELPVEERTRVIDSLLRTLNPPDTEVDKAWSEIAGSRLSELRLGGAQPVSGDQVFSKIKKRFLKMKFEFHPQAKAEFFEAISYYEDKEQGVGEQFAMKVYLVPVAKLRLGVRLPVGGRHRQAGSPESDKRIFFYPPTLKYVEPPGKALTRIM